LLCLVRKRGTENTKPDKKLFKQVEDESDMISFPYFCSFCRAECSLRKLGSKPAISDSWFQKVRGIGFSLACPHRGKEGE
jgi:hypothetical protein